MRCTLRLAHVCALAIAACVATPVAATAIPVSIAVDLYPPTILDQGLSLPPNAVGQTVKPGWLSMRDDVGWPAGSYPDSIVIGWGDGTQEPVPFGGLPPDLNVIRVRMPSHVYAAAGRFEVTVTVTDPAGHSTGALLMGFAEIRARIAPAKGYPRILGTPVVGRLLICDLGPWPTATTPPTVRWRADGELIPAADGSTFRVRPRDVGRRLACQVTARDALSAATVRSKAITIRRATARRPGSWR